MQNPLPKKFDKQANKYNKLRTHDKTFKYRQKIFSDIHGEVLEVGIGVGLNFPLYNRDVNLTGVDFSEEMLKRARQAAKEYPFQTKLIQDDVETIEFPENSFDVIVSSGTLCGYQNPLDVLNNFQKWCRPDGKVLLLEHGLSTNKPLAWLQKSLDPLAVKVAGCHANRDISGLVKSSKLQFVKEERYLAGNVYMIWAKP
ncbi:class I SAM-dependent methyltransferase [Planomicrobium sp. MB-3u-38]|uniref:class I SAM-dependent methyltransferase n=1 Tax=Planomicrobium sp. MB-3u-38 TaxID=2058318 RepID=UPI000C7D37F6|nr:class I SAM-dependent methyltransferase [Planomicrobium sp. MB-3u-38]PKH12172.1 class I SAM-dependent methyltransferase [Planomicrobium sp. MB-3u-38]